MVSKEITVTNSSGLRSRPACYFVQKAMSFNSSIWIEEDDRRVNAKSALGVLSLNIAQGTSITILADGSDEIDAINSLVELVKSGLSEEA